MVGQLQRCRTGTAPIDLDIQFRSEGMRVFLFLRPRLDQRAADTVVGPAFQRPLHDVALQERPQVFEQPADTCGQRVMRRLHHIPDGNQQERRCNDVSLEKTGGHENAQVDEQDREEERGNYKPIFRSKPWSAKSPRPIILVHSYTC